jgi:hypothetical protein
MHQLIVVPLTFRRVKMATNFEMPSHVGEALVIHATLMPSFIKRIEHKSQGNAGEKSPHDTPFASPPHCQKERASHHFATMARGRRLVFSPDLHQSVDGFFKCHGRRSRGRSL